MVEQRYKDFKEKLDEHHESLYGNEYGVFARLEALKAELGEISGRLGSFITRKWLLTSIISLIGFLIGIGLVLWIPMSAAQKAEAKENTVFHNQIDNRLTRQEIAAENIDEDVDEIKEEVNKIKDALVRQEKEIVKAFKEIIKDLKK